MNLAYNDFISLKTNVTEDINDFLVDSQGDICAIKRGALSDGVMIDRSNVSSIKGVTDEPIKTYGTLKVDLYVNDLIITHLFHVVPDRFAIPTNGLIGKDFLRMYRCKLDYDDFSFTIRTEIKNVVIPFSDQLSDDVVLPSRCETFRIFKQSQDIEMNGSYVIPSREILPDVFTANTVAHDRDPIIRVRK